MPVYKLDDFMAFKICRCQLCEKKKIRVQSWNKLMENTWFCISCWKKILTNALDPTEIKIDKNGIEYVTFTFQNEDNETIEINKAIVDIKRKLEQVESIGN